MNSETGELPMGKLIDPSEIAVTHPKHGIDPRHDKRFDIGNKYGYLDVGVTKKRNYDDRVMKHSRDILQNDYCKK